MTRRKRRSHAEWQTLIKQQKESGQSVTIFCQYQNLSSKTFYKHSRAMQVDKKPAVSNKGFIKLKKPSSPQSTEPVCILHYQSCQLQIQATMDANWIAQVIKALS